MNVFPESTTSYDRITTDSSVIVRDLSNLTQIDGRPSLIAVDGFGGSGKSSLAEKIADDIDGAYVIHIDDFLVKEKMGIPNADKEAFDRARLVSQVLQPLQEGRRASFQMLMWDANTLSEPIEVPTVKHVIIEGVSSIHPGIASYYDYKIWVHASPEAAKARGIQRDQAAAYDTTLQWDQWNRNDVAYWEKYRPDMTADIVYDNTVNESS